MGEEITKKLLWRGYGPFVGWSQQALDIAVTLGILYLAVYWRDGQFHEKYQPLLLLTALLLLLIYRLRGVYHRQRTGGLVLQAGLLLQAWLLVLGALLLVGLVTKTTALYSRQALLTWAVGSLAAQLVSHWLVNTLLYLMRRKGYNLKRALVIGSSADAQELAERIEANPWHGIRPLGYLELQPLKKSSDAATAAGKLRCLGTIDQLEKKIKQHGVQMVYLHLPLIESGRILQWMPILLRAQVSVHWVPQLGMFHLLTQSVRDLGGLPVFCLSDLPLDGIQYVGKWLMDKLLALLVLVLASPLMLLLACAVPLTSAGPVFFVQRRVGLNGRFFWLYKFRTMRLHKETKGQLVQARRKDPRLTPIGSFLRISSLDELPQLFNVLKGDMSLVGPRPHAEIHDDHYQRQIETYMLRYRIKPGITGWAQVNGYRGETDRPEKMAVRVKYDLYYIKNWSLWFDLMILLRTVWIVFSGKNAY